MFTIFFDLFAVSMPGNSHPPLGNTLTIAAAILTMTGINTHASPRTPDPPEDLQLVIRHMRISGIIGQQKTHLQGPWLLMATHATWYSDDPLIDDGVANVVRVNPLQNRKCL